MNRIWSPSPPVTLSQLGSGDGPVTVVVWAKSQVCAFDQRCDSTWPSAKATLPARLCSTDGRWKKIDEPVTTSNAGKQTLTGEVSMKVNSSVELCAATSELL